MAKKKYLKLEDVENIYAQFGLLSPKDKKIVNDQFYRRLAMKKLLKTLNFR